MGFFIYVGKDDRRRNNALPEAEPVECEVIEAPQYRTVADLMLEPTPAEIAAAERERIAIEQELAEKAEEERLRRLKIEDPKQYKKETAVGRRFFIFLSVFAVIFAVLIVLLIATSKK